MVSAIVLVLRSRDSPPHGGRNTEHINRFACLFIDISYLCFIIYSETYDLFQVFVPLLPPLEWLLVS